VQDEPFSGGGTILERKLRELRRFTVWMGAEAVPLQQRHNKWRPKHTNGYYRRDFLKFKED
jgi:hypothetical protein